MKQKKILNANSALRSFDVIVNSIHSIMLFDQQKNSDNIARATPCRLRASPKISIKAFDMRPATSRSSLERQNKYFLAPLTTGHRPDSSTNHSTRFKEEKKTNHLSRLPVVARPMSRTNKTRTNTANNMFRISGDDFFFFLNKRQQPTTSSHQGPVVRRRHDVNEEQSGDKLNHRPIKMPL